MWLASIKTLDFVRGVKLWLYYLCGPTFVWFDLKCCLQNVQIIHVCILSRLSQLRHLCVCVWQDNLFSRDPGSTSRVLHHALLSLRKTLTCKFHVTCSSEQDRCQQRDSHRTICSSSFQCVSSSFVETETWHLLLVNSEKWQNSSIGYILWHIVWYLYTKSRQWDTGRWTAASKATTLICIIDILDLIIYIYIVISCI